MYKVFSSYYGSMTTKPTLEEALQWAKHYKDINPESTVTIWKGGVKIQEIKKAG